MLTRAGHTFAALPALLLAAALLLPGCARRTKPRPFTVALSGYLMGQVGPCSCPGKPLGGLARRAGVLDRELESRRGVLTIDAGKFISLDHETQALDTRIVAAVLAELGVDAVNVAMRDARLGKSGLLALREEFGLPFVSANVIDRATGKPLFPAWRRVTLEFDDGGEMDVAVIGATRGNTHSYVPEDADLAYADPGPKLAEAFRKVRDFPCVILLTDGDRSNVADWLAKMEEATGERADIVFSSNLHPTRSTRVLIGQVPMTTTGRQGKFTDIVEAEPLKGGWDIRKQGIPLDARAPESERIAALIERMREHAGDRGGERNR
ncbi:MAG: hypothetical protein MAG453_02180 [Calditrichaeota bacterium]|nr:hypothetical protein [Calditrichota bacterium]